MLHDRHIEWLSRRGIRSGTAESMNVSTIRDAEGNWLCLPYVLRGRIVNRKYRLTSDKRHRMDKGGTLCLWNADVLRSPAVTDHDANVIITEGEFDAMVAMQCGYENAVSVPNGAPAEAIDDPVNSNRYRFLWESLDDLERVKGFVLATDGDGPGRILAHDLAAILGPERCRFVSYPDGSKDLNDLLHAGGQRAVVAAIEQAKPFPVKGLYAMSDFPDQPPLRGMPTGIDCLDELIQIVPGTLTVFTGFANAGKSTIINTILARCVDHAVPVCIASFETAPKPILFDALAQAMLQCPRAELAAHPQRKEVDEDIERLVRIISNALDDDLSLNLSQFLEIARVAVLRDGVRVLILDPWNEIEHKRGRDETGTEYVGRSIREFKAFCRRYQVAGWIVAHPTKPMKGSTSAPSLYDISDSANWANKADYGVVYHRPDKSLNQGEVLVVKVRMGLPGKCGSRAVTFDHRVGRIVGQQQLPENEPA